MGFPICRFESGRCRHREHDPKLLLFSDESRRMPFSHAAALRIRAGEDPAYMKALSVDAPQSEYGFVQQVRFLPPSPNFILKTEDKTMARLRWNAKEAEIIELPKAEDVERITWANHARRQEREMTAAVLAWQKEQQAEAMRKVRVIRAAGAAASIMLFAIGALTAWKAGVWAGVPAWVLGGLALSVTGWL